MDLSNVEFMSDFIKSVFCLSFNCSVGSIFVICLKWCVKLGKNNAFALRVTQTGKFYLFYEIVKQVKSCKKYINSGQYERFSNFDNDRG